MLVRLTSHDLENPWPCRSGRKEAGRKLHPKKARDRGCAGDAHGRDWHQCLLVDNHVCVMLQEEQYAI
jgi:hypothetical protein